MARFVERKMNKGWSGNPPAVIRCARGRAGLWLGCAVVMLVLLRAWSLTAAASAVAPAAAPFTIRLNGLQTGRVFQGIGGLSAGASSRLLYDYPRRQRSAILDYLFKPHFGAGFQILKVEIGGDVDSTDGAEPSFARTPYEFSHPVPADFNRGYEWWLMREAKKRNPHIKLWALQWGAPYWVGDHTLFTRKNAEYVCRFIQGAWKYHHLRIDYCGIWNEHPYSVRYIKLLRQTLNAAGLQRVKIVAADDGGNDAWSVAAHMLKDPALMKAVYAIGAHYPLTWGPINMTFAADAVKTGRPLWASEDFSRPGNWKNAEFMAHEFLLNHIKFHISSDTIWPLIGAWYPALPCGGQGPMLARTPWSGHYDLMPALWTLAHFTQFVPVGWKYLRGQGCGKLPAGGTYCSFKSSSTGNYSIVAETASASRPQQIRLRLSGGLSNAPVQIWSSTRARQMVLTGKITPVHHVLILTLAPHGVYSITTTTGQLKGRHFDPPARPFPMPFVRRFRHGGLGTSPKYFADQHGAFEIARDPADGRRCLRQAVTHVGVGWMPGQGFPLSLVGSRKWRNYQVSVRVKLPQHSFASVLGRVDSAGWHAHVHGCRFNLHASGRWTLWSGSSAVGRGSIHLSSGVWHAIALQFSGMRTVALVDGRKVAWNNSPVRQSGMAGIGSGWNHVEYRHFSVTPVSGPTIHYVDLARHASAAASSEWSDKYAPAMAISGEPGRRWNAGHGAAAGQWLEIHFPHAVICNTVYIHQFGGRIITGRLQSSENGHIWRTVAAFKPQGKAQFQIRFAAAKVRFLRLLVDSTAGNQPPSIYRFSVYHLPAI